MYRATHRADRPQESHNIAWQLANRELTVKLFCRKNPVLIAFFIHLVIFLFE
jgi:hypothetical protein